MFVNEPALSPSPTAVAAGVLDQPIEARAAAPDASRTWKAIIEDCKQPHAGKATWQLINTLGTYVLVWYLMYLTLEVSWWLTLPLSVLAAGLLVRTFIIFHDCGHGSFFASRKANDFWGFVTGLITFTPYYHWRGEHAIHHGSTGDLDRRGIGDIWTMTVEEYLAASRMRRFSYRLARNPFILLVIAPMVLFLFIQRVPNKEAKRHERNSVWLMNGAVALLALGMCALFGTLPYLFIQFIVLMIAGSAGIWLFYLQHQFEDVYWERGENWDYDLAALQGSSFLKLPRLLQWFSGNIGFHHIHHLSPRIPNYNLERCHESDPLFQSVPSMTFFSSLRSLALRLWDESSRKLVSFRQLREARRALQDEDSPQGTNGARG